MCVDGVIWIITGACNLRCRHCYAVKWRGKPELSLESKLKLIEEFAECGVEYVNISGGEPLLSPHLRKVIEGLRQHDIEVSIVTNGVLLSDEWARFFSQHEVFVFVSLDGPKKIHDMLRGGGAFDKVIEGIKRLSRYGVEYTTVMAVSRISWRFVRDYILLAVNLGVEYPALIPVMPFGKALENNLYVRQEEIVSAINEAAKTAKEVGATVQLWCMPFAPSAVEERLLKYVSWSFCRLASVADIDPQGNLLLCDVLDYKLSNAVEKGFKRAVYEAETHPLTRLIYDPPKLPKACRECPWVYYCRGGCYARAYAIYKDFNAGDPLCPRVQRSRNVLSE